MLRPYPLIILVLCVILLLAGPASSAPTAFSRTGSVARRADGSFSGAKTVTTVRKTNTSSGLVIETCEITLTPLSQPDGTQAVEEVKRCKITVGDEGAQDGDGTGAPNASSSSPPSLTTSSASTNPPTTSSSPQTSSAPATTSTSISDGASPTSSSSQSASSNTSSPAPVSSGTASNGTSTSTTSSTASASASSTPNPAISVQGLSTVASTAAPTGASTTSSVATSPPESSSSASSTTAPASASSSGSGTAAAAEQSSSSNFAVPGKKLSVLPIGLGVFAGISVIALIVVGLVTYERTKYRKAFRQRKLAEAGANLGYGGMAERA